MRADVGNGYRVPTTRWSGHYFSNTLPGNCNASEPETALNAVSNNFFIYTYNKKFNSTMVV